MAVTHSAVTFIDDDDDDDDDEEEEDDDDDDDCNDDNHNSKFKIHPDSMFDNSKVPVCNIWK